MEGETPNADPNPPPNHGFSCGHESIVRVRNDSTSDKVGQTPDQSCATAASATINPNSLLLQAQGLTSETFDVYCMPCLDRKSIWALFKVKPISRHLNLERYYCPLHATKYKEEIDPSGQLRLTCEDAVAIADGSFRCRVCEGIKDEGHDTCRHDFCPNRCCRACQGTLVQQGRLVVCDCRFFESEDAPKFICRLCYPNTACDLCHEHLCKVCEQSCQNVLRKWENERDNRISNQLEGAVEKYTCDECFEKVCPKCLPPTKTCNRCSGTLCPYCADFHGFKTFACQACNKICKCFEWKHYKEFFDCSVCDKSFCCDCKDHWYCEACHERTCKHCFTPAKCKACKKTGFCPNCVKFREEPLIACDVFCWMDIVGSLLNT